MSWDGIYEASHGLLWYPDEGVIRFIARFLRIREGLTKWIVKRKVGLLLDLGCGNGRHVALFAEQGFHVCGCDVSERAIDLAREWLRSRRLKAQLDVCEGDDLPYQDESFDLVLCFGVMDHVPIEKANGIMKEIRRVLVPNGLVYVSLRSTFDVEVPDNASHTLVLNSGYEKGLVQHFFDQSEIAVLLRGFRVLDVELHEEKFPLFLGKDKNSKQTSEGIFGVIDLTRNFGWSRYSRWHVVCAKEE